MLTVTTTNNLDGYEVVEYVPQSFKRIQGFCWGQTAWSAHN